MKRTSDQHGGTVLFVDDEPFILQLMQDYLQDAPFQVLTAPDPATAFHILQDVAVDMVISDYTMPDMTGSELLAQVKTQHPEVRRVIATGHMDVTAAVTHIHNNTAAAIYQKPLNFQTLHTDLQNALTLCQLLRDQGFLQLINNLHQLPTLPALYQQYHTAVTAQAPMQEIAQIIAVDPSVTTQVIRLANSAFMGHATIQSVEQALVKIGLNAVQNILLTVVLVEQLEWTTEQRAALPHVFTQMALTNAGFAFLYRHLYQQPLPEELTTVGLLYQIGRVLLLSAEWDHYQVTRAYQRHHPDRLFVECEIQHGYAGRTAADLSSYLLAWWNFPPLLVQLALHYQDSTQLPASLQPVAELLLYVERLVQLVMYDITDNPSTETLFDSLDVEANFQKELYIHLEERYHRLQDIYKVV